ncbi:MAG: sulfotransferase [Anaerolineales bacterium]
MPFNIRYYLTYFYYSFFRSKGTPGKLSVKRIFLLLFLFFAYPIWNIYIRLGYYLDNLFFSEFKQVQYSDPVFIIGNYRSGSTFLHRLLLRDQQFTCLKAWEIYFSPAITQRWFIRLLNRISRRIGNPIGKFVAAFDQSLNGIYAMHETGMFTFEQDSQVFYHSWSSYNLFAPFPFPELAQKYIYYDQKVPETRRRKEFTYYRDVLKRQLFLNPGKQYISKNPDFSPAVETIKEFFPNAKFINLVRPPEQMIPSTVNLWANNWRAYGSPEELFPLVDTLQEHVKHWYQYPHQRLSSLPSDRYLVVDFERLVSNPKREIERIYQQFGFEFSAEYHKIMEEETIKSRNFTSGNSYSLPEMGLDIEELKQQYKPILESYNLNLQGREDYTERT